MDSRSGMRQDGHKPGGTPPQYDEIMFSRSNGDVRHAPTSMPWWNPRYWRKRVWAAVSAVIVIVIVIAVAVGVTQAKKNNAYPDYSALSYSLSDTCKWESPWPALKPSRDRVADGGVQMEGSLSLTSSTTLPATT